MDDCHFRTIWKEKIKKLNKKQQRSKYAVNMIEYTLLYTDLDKIHARIYGRFLSICTIYFLPPFFLNVIQIVRKWQSAKWWSLNGSISTHYFWIYYYNVLLLFVTSFVALEASLILGYSFIISFRLISKFRFLIWLIQLILLGWLGFDRLYTGEGLNAQFLSKTNVCLDQHVLFG